MKLHFLIESMLFFKGEPLSVGEFERVLDVKREDVEQALNKLEEELQERGIRLVRQEDTVELATAPEAHDVISHLTKQELTKKLGKAGIETLTIILYHSPITRRDIDFIRGVNSSSIIRNLSIRGLIEKEEVLEPTKQIVYKPTTQLLRHLGISKQSDLPDYEAFQNETSEFLKNTKANS